MNTQTSNGNYTKHYYNGTERIASRLGDNTTTIAINNNTLENRKLLLEERFRNEIQELISEPTHVDMPPMLDILNLQPTGTPNDIYYYHPNHLGSTSFVTDQNQTITQGFLYAPFGEITTEYNINFGNNTIPKYSFNAKELDEETGMFYYEARYYAPPTFTSRDPLFEKYFWMTPYAYCANNPVKYVDPSGMFDDEAKANKYHQRAVKKYGRDRVGDVYNASSSGNPDYQFRIYDKGKEKNKQWTSFNENGINVSANRGNVISERSDYRRYKHSQGNDVLTIQASLTLGPQAGGKIKKMDFSANISSIDVASIKYSTGQKIKFSHVDEYGLTTHRMGLSLVFIGCNYTKEPYQDATYTFGPTIKIKSIESLLGISKEGVHFSFGAALILGINIDINYNW